MTQGIHQLTANMVNQLNRVDTISNNLANLNTVGFKEDSIAEGSFNYYLTRMQEKKKDISKISYIMNTIPKIDSNFIDGQQGSISPTGNKLDFALNGTDIFFKIKNNKGDILLTRDGQFKLLNGKLVTQNNYEVLNQNDRPIQLDETDDIVPNIAIIKTKFNNLNKIGDNNFKIKNIKETEQLNNTREFIVQGSIERSTVNSVKSMVTLIEAQRKFEQAQKALTGINDIDKKVIDSIGNGR